MSRPITRGSSASNNAIVGAPTANEGRAALSILIGGLLLGSYAMYKGATMLGVVIWGAGLIGGAAAEGS